VVGLVILDKLGVAGGAGPWWRDGWRGGCRSRDVETEVGEQLPLQRRGWSGGRGCGRLGRLAEDKAGSGSGSNGAGPNKLLKQKPTG
jgi:hypothetical protein